MGEETTCNPSNKKSASDQNLKRLSINQNVETWSKDFKHALSKQDT